jgi:rubrerythrin
MYGHPRRDRGRAAALLGSAGIVAAMTVVGLAGTASAQTRPMDPLLIGAARTESAAYLQYNAYADAARSRGQTDIADAWRSIAKVEHQDHYTHEVTLARLYSASDNTANLKTAIAQAQRTAKDYETYAGCEPHGSQAQRDLRTLAARERHDAMLLHRALAGNIPKPPRVATDAVATASVPKYSGMAYTDLTDALADPAWNWAEYQWMAKTAVDTGHARLAALFGGLQAQEAQRNWVEISNDAGYVNDAAMNLKESIRSEQGAQQMYANYARQAQAAGDTTVAAAFTSIKGDEHGHEQTFTAEYHRLTGTRT